jgi:hypothetical protein
LRYSRCRVAPDRGSELASVKLVAVLVNDFLPTFVRVEQALCDRELNEVFEGRAKSFTPDWKVPTVRRWPLDAAILAEPFQGFARSADVDMSGRMRPFCAHVVVANNQLGKVLRQVDAETRPNIR